MSKLKTGEQIQLANGGVIEILGELGEGGQGTVYKSGYKGKEYALIPISNK